MVRLSDGEWCCRAPITLQVHKLALQLTPGATYRKGERLNGLDVATLLDDWLATGRLPPGTAIR
jgi:hypothetical protein